MFGFLIYDAIIVTDNDNYLKCFDFRPIMITTLVKNFLIMLLFFNYSIYDVYYEQICENKSLKNLKNSERENCSNKILTFIFLFWIEIMFFCWYCTTALLLTIKCINEYKIHCMAVYVLYIINFILTLEVFCPIIGNLIVCCFSTKYGCCPCKCDICDTQNTTITTYVTRYDTNDINKNIDENNIDVNTNYELEQTIKKPNDIDDINIISDIENNININLQENNENKTLRNVVFVLQNTNKNMC